MKDIKRLLYIDIHAHCQFDAYENDRAEVIARAHDAGVWMINVGTNKETSRHAVTLASQFAHGVYSVVGLHPTHTVASHADPQEIEKGNEVEEFDFEYYKNLATDKSVVAIGEVGLDYFRVDKDTQKIQEKIFIEQIHLANEIKKPLMLHVRPSKDSLSVYDRVYEILVSESQVPAHLHFFAGSLSHIKKFLEIGSTFSFTGVITFAKEYEELVEYIPLTYMCAETDCPYVTPAPYRGKRNEPLYVREVVKTIARIKEKDDEETRSVLLANAIRIFNLTNLE